jgi:sulfur carrier protein
LLNPEPYHDITIMQITVNDQPTEIPEACSIVDLLSQLHLPGTRVAVEVNRTLVRRVDHAATSLQSGDKVEVVTLVGGG